MRKEYVVVALLDDAKDRERILQWPLHITILPWFSFHDYEGFCQKAKEVIQVEPSFDVSVGFETRWGERNVNLLQYSIPLHRLHDQLLKIAKKHGRMQIRDHHYAERSYVPHITHQGRQKIEEGRKIKVDSLYLIERDMSHHVKTVAEIFRLAK